jgi:RNA polymerase subunit RPABC4/transcription elongation factor Spt4
MRCYRLGLGMEERMDGVVGWFGFVVVVEQQCGSIAREKGRYP